MSVESSIAEMRRLAAIPVHYDMGDRYGNDADRDGRIEYDCSSAVSKAVGLSLNNNTETLKINRTVYAIINTVIVNFR